MKKSIFTIFVLLSAFIKAQVNIEPNPETPALNYGGKPQLEQILKTQLYIAGPYQETDKEVSIYFTVTKTGKIQDEFFKEEYSNFYRDEIKRILRFCVYEPAKKSSRAVDSYGSLTILFSGKNYKAYLKERKKTKLNLDDKKADTTFTIYDVADKSPEFYKGDDALPQFIFDNIEYPNVAKTQSIEGTVNLTFIVEANGFVTNVKALKTVGGGCTEEAIRIANLMRWKPAEKDGKYVRYKTTYPITFNLKNVNKDTSNTPANN